jgi:hypothetical protein
MVPGDHKMAMLGKNHEAPEGDAVVAALILEPTTDRTRLDTIEDCGWSSKRRLCRQSDPVVMLPRCQ